MSLSRFTPEPWMGAGICSQVDHELFFPEPGATGGPAKRICAQCPVRARCLEFALEHQERGIWGGTSDIDRKRLRRAAAAAA